ncbi:hypothetical protein KQX54_011030 [Cotesia glomerata]|uniref:Uncharacterized protein n=1 Tax=Cotesia glomerata TaxID=32391 RepID=A0AAV7J734_COTGL|nr:hypothetical protein KQX54_011030 [Cotesia glomerata]
MLNRGLSINSWLLSRSRRIYGFPVNNKRKRVAVVAVIVVVLIDGGTYQSIRDFCNRRDELPPGMIIWWVSGLNPRWSVLEGATDRLSYCENETDGSAFHLRSTQPYSYFKALLSNCE